MSEVEKQSPIMLYIQEQEAHQKELLEIYQYVKAKLPHATERISYGMPTFRGKRNLFHFAAYDGHIGLYPGSGAIAALEEQLGPYKHSKGTIRVGYEQAMPWELIDKLIAYNVEHLG